MGLLLLWKKSNFFMKNVIITGASGMIGSLVLEECLSSSLVQKVTSVTRKPSGLNHPKLIEVIHTDFTDYSAISHFLTDQDVCFFCIGVYTGQVPRDEFNRITIDYTLAFAGALRAANSLMRFCFLSGQGADSTEKSRVLFARAKGIAENGLIGLGFEGIHIFRPGYIYPVVPRKEPNFTYRMMRLLWCPVSSVYPNIGVTSVRLATRMVEVGLNGETRVVYENDDIRSA
jgi:hypothetical protein